MANYTVYVWNRGSANFKKSKYPCESIEHAKEILWTIVDMNRHYLYDIHEGECRKTPGSKGGRNVYQVNCRNYFYDDDRINTIYWVEESA